MLINFSHFIVDFWLMRGFRNLWFSICAILDDFVSLIVRNSSSAYYITDTNIPINLKMVFGEWKRLFPWNFWGNFTHLLITELENRLRYEKQLSWPITDPWMHHTFNQQGKWHLGVEFLTLCQFLELENHNISYFSSNH